MTDYNLGTARGVIEIDARPAERGAKKADDAVSKVGKSAASSNANVQKMATGMGVASTAIVAGFAVAVNSAAKFESRISAIGAVSGASKGELEDMRKKALQLGADTVFSASEAASAMEELAKAGISTNDILHGAADAAVALAAAGGVGIPEAAELAADAMNSFQLTAKQLPGVVDSIAGAANASSIDVGQFGQSLKQVGAVAHLAGQGFDDVATAIALMGKAGIKGSDAGTSLKTMLMNLQPMTDRQTALFEKLGIITKDGANQFFDAAGKAKPLAEISEVLAKSLEGMTQQQKLATLEIMFGSDAIRAAAVLSKEGAAGFADMSANMKKVSAADVAKKRLDNFAGTMEQLKGSMETLAITLGQILIPALNKLASFLVKVVNAFQSMPEWAQKTLVGLLAFAGVALGVASAVVKISRAIKTFQAAMKIIKSIESLQKALTALRAVMSTAFGPIGLAVIAIALLAYVVYRNWGTIKKAFKAGMDWIKRTFGPFFGGLVSGVKKVWGSVTGFFTGSWDKIKGIFSAALEFVAKVIGVYIRMYTRIIKAIIAPFVAIFNFIKNVIKNYLVDELKRAAPAILAFKRIIETVTNAVGRAFDWVRDKVTLAIAIVKGVIGAVVGWFQEKWDQIKLATMLAWNYIKDKVTGPVIAIRDFLSRVISGIVNFMKARWETLKANAQRVWNLIKTYIINPINSAKDTVLRIAGGIRDKLLGIWESVKERTGKVFETLKGLITKPIAAAWDGIKRAVNGILEIFRKLIRAYNHVADIPLNPMPHMDPNMIPTLAKGGVAFGPALIGETFPSAGEAAIPLAGRGAQLVAQALAREIAGLGLGNDSGPGVIVNEHIYNPIHETASDTTARRLSTMAALGGLGRAAPGRPIARAGDRS